MANLSPKFPLFFGPDGGYASNTTVKQVVKQNFKNLILTSPGERIMIPDFGVGIKRYLFEQNSVSTASEMQRKIEEQVRKYMPFVEVQEFLPTFNENELIITIKYFILPLSETDILNINV